jgi:L-asparaginase
LEPNTLDTFEALEIGYLSEMISDEPFCFYPLVTLTGWTTVAVSKITSIPRVDVLYSPKHAQGHALQRYSALRQSDRGKSHRLLIDLTSYWLILTI